MFNCGMMAVELTNEKINELFTYVDRGAIECSVNLDKKQLTFTCNGQELAQVDFTISEFDEALVRAGGWVEYADAHY
jgi:3-isopropylmalate/(R)-2-methylmalate dehydratase small subunit